mgnify:CR=1
MRVPDKKTNKNLGGIRHDRKEFKAKAARKCTDYDHR